MPRCDATFTTVSWDEEPMGDDNAQPKLTRASVVKDYSGGMAGRGTVEYIMVYVDPGTAEFIGVEQFEGTVDGRSGTLVFRHTGTFHQGVVKSRWTVIEGSGRGDLSGVAGTVDFEAGHASEYPIVLEYELPD